MPSYKECCKNYYLAQAGSGGLPRYDPQRGHGIFSSLVKNVVPFLTKKVLPTVVKTAAAVGTDLLAGESLKDSAQLRGKQALGRIVRSKPVQRTINRLVNQAPPQGKHRRRGRVIQRRKTARRKNAFGF